MSDIKEFAGYKLKDELARNKIEQLENRTEQLEELKTLVLIGDSWSMLNYPYVSDQNKMWYNMLVKQLNMNLKNYATSGAGYTTGNTFESQVNTAIADTSLDKDNVSIVLVFGGYNDLMTGNMSDFETYANTVKSVITKLKTNFTKARIIIAGCNTPNTIHIGTNNPTISNIRVTDLLNNCAIEEGVQFIDTVPFVLCYDKAINETNHPTEIGQYFLTNGFLSTLLGGRIRRSTTISATKVAKFTRQGQSSVDMEAYYQVNDYELELTIRITPLSALSSGKYKFSSPHFLFKKIPAIPIYKGDTIVGNFAIDDTDNIYVNITGSVAKNDYVSAYCRVQI